ncbi:3-hydroxyacyl-CoA dehydrogenase [Sulfitobacter noctilucae]|uniref:3-hydroxyacyl-CoA dehydrogenase family protein n=1 Tax=Sulfitobacter noctilucae TaxID=1342302 RepID=UPI00046A46FC|nr:3-hydroxyacyl-CoA dehydrogenase family protein [Sulfitobacter noctilucae]KIN65335.1 3-hydroxyacyl-CoA dehydrogenase [Sulfitobacter noctilucae]
MINAKALTRIQDAFWLQAEHLMYHHTNPWELDEALCDWGYAMGPCEAQDLAGLEKVLARNPDRPVPILPRMVAEGRMGKGGGVGYYRYPGGGGAVIDPLIEDLILEEAWFGKVTRSELADVDLVTQMHSALRDVCAKLRGNGLTKESLGELLVQGLSFPAGKVSTFIKG